MKLIKREHDETGKMIKGYGMKHWIKLYNLESINNEGEMLPEDLSDFGAVERFLSDDEETSDVDDMTKSAFRDLSADEQRELLTEHGVEEPGKNLDIRLEQFEEL